MLYLSVNTDLFTRNIHPADAKPEWLPWEQILEYEAAMGTDPETKAEGCKALEKRGIFVMPET